MPDVFYRLYAKLIENGYHPKQWREVIRVVLKKQDRLSQISKSYRIISLLNCLRKIAEKIIATRLGYLAETTNLLYPEQIGGRSRKLAIDAAFSLIYDI